MSAKIRKHQTTLICSGVAVIAFGLWSILRTVLMLIFRKSYIKAMIDGINVDVSIDTITRILYLVVFVILIIDILFRVYAGMNAICEGNGKHRRFTYIVLSILYVAAFLGTDVLLLFHEGATLKSVVSLLIDVTSQIAFLEIICSSVSLRWYTRKLNAGEGECHAA